VTSRQKPAKRRTQSSGRRSIVNVLVSGGIDSAALLVFYQQQKFSVRALFVDFGQPAAKQELRAVRSVCRHYRVRVSTATVRTRATFSLGEIPGRNAFLIFTATLMNGKEPGVIAIGIHEGLPYYDCGEGFVAAVQAIVDGYSAGSVKIAAPFLKWSKPTIWAFCKKHKVPIHLTYSCEKGSPSPCGKCLSCMDREALSVL